MDAAGSCGLRRHGRRLRRLGASARTVCPGNWPGRVPGPDGTHAGQAPLHPRHVAALAAFLRQDAPGSGDGTCLCNAPRVGRGSRRPEPACGRGGLPGPRSARPQAPRGRKRTVRTRLSWLGHDASCAQVPSRPGRQSGAALSPAGLTEAASGPGPRPDRLSGPARAKAGTSARHARQCIGDRTPSGERPRASGDRARRVWRVRASGWRRSPVIAPGATPGRLRYRRNLSRSFCSAGRSSPSSGDAAARPG